MGYSHLTDEEIMDILNDFSNNITYREISEKYNIDINSCCALAKMYGITQDRRKARLKLNERVIELYQEGYNYSEIGKIAGCSRTSVTQILDRHGVPRHHGKRNKDIVKRNMEIARLYQSGNYTHVELGKMFNMPYKSIGMIINETLHRSSDKSLDTRDDKVNNMLNEGKTNREIGNELNIPKTTIASHIINQNFHKRISERNDKIVELYQSGNYTKKELAVMFDLSVNSISNIIRKNKNNSVK